jgi:hypothetical protein
MEENRRKNDEQERELQALLVELQENADSSTVSVTDTEQEEKWNERKAVTEINVLNLPPRKEVHGQKKKRAHIKLSKPFIRLAIVIVLVIIVLGILFFLNGSVISI